MRSFYLYFLTVLSSLVFIGCGVAKQTTAPTPPQGTVSNILTVERPQSVTAKMNQRGDQDKASPTLTVVSPAEGAMINRSTVKVKLTLGGDLKGYKPGMDEVTHTGNHIHVILDNQPYEAYYNLDQEFELRNVADGMHTLRVFPSRPWHESYKNDGAFQMVRFTVKNGGGDTEKPTTTAGGDTMANANTAKPTPEGKEMKESAAGEVDPKKPLLTFSRPKGEYKGVDANDIMFDFWLLNAKMVGDGGDYRVRYTIGESEPRLIDKWEAIWLSRWPDGKHSIKFELVDKDGNAVENGGYNTTTREITITK